MKKITAGSPVLLPSSTRVCGTMVVPQQTGINPGAHVMIHTKVTGAPAKHSH